MINYEEVPSHFVAEERQAAAENEKSNFIEELGMDDNFQVRFFNDIDEETGPLFSGTSAYKEELFSTPQEGDGFVRNGDIWLYFELDEEEIRTAVYQCCKEIYSTR